MVDWLIVVLYSHAYVAPAQKAPNAPLPNQALGLVRAHGPGARDGQVDVLCAPPLLVECVADLFVGF
jgi:hypothetical protein